MRKGIPAVFVILCLSAYWIFSAVWLPARLSDRVRERLEARTGLETDFASAFQLTEDSVELRRFTANLSPACRVLEAPCLRIAGGPGFEPPYFFTLVEPDITVDANAPISGLAQSREGGGAAEIRFSGGRLTLAGLTGLEDMTFHLGNLSGSLSLPQGAQGVWSGTGTFGPSSSGRFEVEGKGTGLVKADVDGGRFWTVEEVLACLSSSRPLPLLPDRGSARLRCSYAAAHKRFPFRMTCSFRDVGFGKEARATGFVSLAVEPSEASQPEMGGNFVLENLSVKGLALTRATGNLEGRGGIYKVKDLRGRLLGGRCEGGLALDVNGGGSLSFELHVPEGSIEEVPFQWLGTTVPVKGAMSFDLHVDAAPLAPENLFGRGRFQCRDVQLGLLPAIAGLEQYLVIHQAVRFDTLDGDFHVTPEGIVLRKGHAQGPYLRFEVARASRVGFDRALDLELTVKRSEKEERHFPIFTKLSKTMKKMFLTPFEDLLTLHVRISGSMESPRYELLLPGRGK